MSRRSPTRGRRLRPPQPAIDGMAWSRAGRSVRSARTRRPRRSGRGTSAACLSVACCMLCVACGTTVQVIHVGLMLYTDSTAHFFKRVRCPLLVRGLPDAHAPCARRALPPCAAHRTTRSSTRCMDRRRMTMRELASTASAVVRPVTVQKRNTLSLALVITLAADVVSALVHLELFAAGQTQVGWGGVRPLCRLGWSTPTVPAGVGHPIWRGSGRSGALLAAAARVPRRDAFEPRARGAPQAISGARAHGQRFCPACSALLWHSLLRV